MKIEMEMKIGHNHSLNSLYVNVTRMYLLWMSIAHHHSH